MYMDHLRDPASFPPGFYFFEDFLRQDAPVDLGALDFTAVGGTIGTLATQAANGGVARISGAATVTASGGQLQAEGAHVVTDGKFLSFKARAQINESTSSNGATASDLYLGLFPVDTSIVASLPADGIYFVKANSGTAIQCIVRVNSVNVFSQTIVPVADKLMHTYGIGIVPANGVCTVEFSMDGARVARVDGVTYPASTVFLTPSFAFQSADTTGTKFSDLDYIGSYQDR